MAYFIWLQFFPISWRSQSKDREQFAHIHTQQVYQNTYLLVCRTHPLFLHCLEMNALETLYYHLLHMLPCLYLLPYSLKTEAFLTAALLIYNSVQFQLAVNVFIPWSLLVGQRSTGGCRVKAAGLLASRPRRRWILCSGTPSTCCGTLISQGWSCGSAPPDTP